jgi:transcriptional regulator with XRE-family HTH domain
MLIANCVSSGYHRAVLAARMLRTARRRAGLTQRDLAEASGIPQSSIARIERGATVPRIDTFQRLLQATGQQLSSEPRLGSGVDRSTIRAMLHLTPEQRGHAAAVAGRNLIALRREARVLGQRRT